MNDWLHVTNSKLLPTFLHLLNTKGLSYSIITSARSRLSVFISLEWLEDLKHYLVCCYTKGPYNTTPRLPKYSFTCDVEIVMKNPSHIPNKYKEISSEKSHDVKHELGVASYELLVTIWKFKSASWNSKVRVQIQELQVQIQDFKFTS